MDRALEARSDMQGVSGQYGADDGLMIKILKRAAVVGGLCILARENPEAAPGLLKLAGKYRVDTTTLLDEIMARAATLADDHG